jgi:hypothetical protein
MQILEIKNAVKAFSDYPKVQQDGFKEFIDQTHEDSDGSFIAAFPNASTKKSKKTLVMVFENSFIIYFHKAFKKIAYKFTMDELEFESIENSGLKSLFGGKFWIQLNTLQMPIGDKPFRFQIGSIYYQDGIRTIQPTPLATLRLGDFLRNIQKVVSDNKGKDFKKISIITLHENEKGKIKPQKFSNIVCQEFLLLYEDKGYLVNEDIFEFTSRDISRTEEIEYKQFLNKTNYLDMHLKGGINIKLGIFNQGQVSKESASQLKTQFDIWSDKSSNIT